MELAYGGSSGLQGRFVCDWPQGGAQLSFDTPGIEVVLEQLREMLLPSTLHPSTGETRGGDGVEWGRGAVVIVAGGTGTTPLPVHFANGGVASKHSEGRGVWDTRFPPRLGAEKDNKGQGAGEVGGERCAKRQTSLMNYEKPFDYSVNPPFELPVC